MSYVTDALVRFHDAHFAGRRCLEWWKYSGHEKYPRPFDLSLVWMLYGLRYWASWWWWFFATRIAYHSPWCAKMALLRWPFGRSVNIVSLYSHNTLVYRLFYKIIGQLKASIHALIRYPKLVSSCSQSSRASALCGLVAGIDVRSS